MESDCPAFQRHHKSDFCVAEIPARLPMVLHRPVEPARLFGNWPKASRSFRRARLSELEAILSIFTVPQVVTVT